MLGVDPAEAGDVYDHQPGYLAVAVGARHLEVEVVQEQPAVAQPREGVVVTEAAHLLLELPALGDVLELGDVVQRLSLGVADERHRQERRNDLPGGVEIALLDLEGRNLAGVESFPLRDVVERVVGVDDAVEALADELLGRVAGDLAQGAIDKQPAALAVQQARADGGALEDLLEAGAGPRREQVGAPTRGHVDQEHDAAAGWPLRPATALHERADVDHQAVLLAGPDLARAGLAGERRVEKRLDRLPQLLRQGVPERLAGSERAALPTRANARPPANMKRRSAS